MPVVRVALGLLCGQGNEGVRPPARAGARGVPVRGGCAERCACQHEQCVFCNTFASAQSGWAVLAAYIAV
jgi:hypothetical protein